MNYFKRPTVRKSGSSLIETLVVISASSVALGVAITLLNTAYTHDRNARLALQISHSYFQLGEQFRAESHQAVSAEPVLDSSGIVVGLQFKPDDAHTTVFRIQGQRIVHQRRKGESVEFTDSYLVPKRGNVRFEIQPGSGLPVVALTVTPPAESNPYLPFVSPFVVQAAVGLLVNNAEKSP